MTYVTLDQLGKCACARCNEGALTAGHCVDIDGDFWHDCPAVRVALAPETKGSQEVAFPFGAGVPRCDFDGHLMTGPDSCECGEAQRRAMARKGSEKP